MIRVYISPSSQEHNIGVGKYGTEEQVVNKIADVVVRELIKTKEFSVYRNTTAMDLGGIIKDSNLKKPDYHIAIHSNAGGGGKARGCVVFAYAPNTKSDDISKKIYKHLSELTEVEDRGVKYKPEFAEIGKTTGSATLIEVSFHDNVEDANWIMKNIEQIGISIVKGICEHCGIVYPIIDEELKLVEEMYKDGLITTKDYWLQVLKGLTPINLDYFKVICKRATEKIK